LFKNYHIKLLYLKSTKVFIILRTPHSLRKLIESDQTKKKAPVFTKALVVRCG